MANGRRDGGATYREVFAVGEFRVLLAGWVLFMLGETMQMFALATLVYQQTGSPALQSLAFVIGFLPHILAGGTLLSLADRTPPRALIAGTDLVRAAVLLLIAVAAMPAGPILALVFAKSLLVPVAGAARSGLVADLLTGDRYVLGRSVQTVVGAAMQIAGVALGGVLVSVASPRAALLVSAGTAVAAALLSRLCLRARPARTVAARLPPAHRSAVRATWAANRRLFGDPAVRGLLACQWLFPACVTGAESLAVPYMAETGRPAGAAAGLLAGAAAGMLVGDLVVGRFVPPRTRERLVPVLAAVTVAPLLVFAASPPPAIAIAATTVTGTGSAYLLGLQRRLLAALPADCRNQGLGLASTGLMTAQGLGAVVLGTAAGVVGSAAAVMAAAGAAGLLGVVALRGSLRPAGPDRAGVGERRVVRNTE